jgi:nitrous oxidase accessory protein NosD
MIALLSAMMVTPAAATTWDVYEGESIQDAINNAVSGDTVFVHAGTYVLSDVTKFCLCLDKPYITLKGEGADMVTLDNNEGDIGIGVHHSEYNSVDAHGCVVEGFRITNGEYAIHLLDTAPNCIIRNNVIDGGSGLTGSVRLVDNTTFTNNVVINTTGVFGAVLLHDCQFSKVVNNIIRDNVGAGILIHSDAGTAANNIITGNNISSNGYGIFAYSAGPGHRIYLNNFVDNGVTATTFGTTPPATTYWNSTEPIEYTYGGNTYTNYLGNNWGSDYSGTDGDGDGIGDSNYVVPDGLGNDFRPLVAPFEDYPAPDQPDLTPTAITLNCGNLFANESNEICAVIENIGEAAAGEFNVSIDIDGFSGEVTVAGLAVGANTTVCVTDPTIRNAGDVVTVTVTADCNGIVGESDETNNVLAQSETVVNNGYKGKRYTGGDDIATHRTFDLQGNLVYSVGDSAYMSGGGGWTDMNVAWDASDLPVPSTATIKEARLYVPYTYAKDGAMPNNYDMTFNDCPLEYDAHYWDDKTRAYGTNYASYGMLVYDVTTGFSKSGNTAEFTSLWSGLPAHSGASIRGMLLTVVYADDSEPERLIYLNEEFDMLYGGSDQCTYYKCTTPEEATAYAPFTGTIDLSRVASAKLITVAPGAGPAEGELLFNGQTWTDVWNFTGSTQMGIDERDVSNWLESTGNEAGFQSSDCDWMEASNSMLVVEKTPATAKVYFVPEDIRLPKYCDTMNVGVWIDTDEAITSGQMIFNYAYGCMNVTDFQFNATNWNVPPSGWAWAPGQVTIMPVNLIAGGVGPGLVHVGDLTVHCCNDTGYCFTDLAWDKDPANSYLFNATPAKMTSVNWKDGTFRCNIPDLVITAVKGNEISGTLYNVSYTVKNIGEVDAAPSSAGLLVDGSLKETMPVSLLTPGEEKTYTFTSEINQTGTVDSLLVCADYCGEVVELDEDNNCMIGRYPGEVVIKVQPAVTYVQPQDQFDVKIYVDTKGIDVYAVQYRLTYNTSIVRAETQNKDTFLGSISETMVVVNEISQPYGEVCYAETRKVPGSVTDSDNVTNIHFIAIGVRGDTTPLTLDDIIISDEDGVPIAYTIEDGSVEITENTAPVPIGVSKHRINNVAQKYQSTAILCSCSYDPDYPDKGGNITYIRWAFGDGQYGTSEGLPDENNCTCKEHKYESWLWNTSIDDYDPFNAILTVTDDGCPELTNTTEFNVTVYIAGDANGDGEVNILDAVWVGKHWRAECGTPCANCEGYLWDNEQKDGADLNNDCEINILDAVVIGANWRHVAW